ncbi:hypothetical protein H0H92_008203, partial [Tricholoma furcatifolium]
MQLWSQILKNNANPVFSRKAIYQLWLDATSSVWKHAANEVESAKLLIDAASQLGNTSDPAYGVKPIETHNEEGFIAIAIALPSLLE